MKFFKSLPLVAGLGIGVLAGPTEARAGDPGTDAIEEFRSGEKSTRAIENRFFLKRNRFEIAPMFGYVPNNPFAKRFLGGAYLGFHFNEAFAVQATVAYSPDLKESDLKGLTTALVVIAHSGPGGATFQQPLDKLVLLALFGGTWTPFYGKINLLGETVLNFDFYLSAGMGMVSKVNYFAVYDDAAAPGEEPINLEGGDNEVEFSPSAGVGANFFINQFMAVKLDGRFAFWVDQEPQYCQGAECEPVSSQRLYNNFIVSGGLAFYFPNMKPRLYDF